jgi:hypothetical protein
MCVIEWDSYFLRRIVDKLLTLFIFDRKQGFYLTGKPGCNKNLPAERQYSSLLDYNLIRIVTEY